MMHAFTLIINDCMYVCTWNFALLFQKEYENIPITNRISFLVAVISQNDGALDEQQLAAVLLRRIITGSFEEAFGNLGLRTFNLYYMFCFNFIYLPSYLSHEAVKWSFFGL